MEQNNIASLYQVHYQPSFRSQPMRGIAIAALAVLIIGVLASKYVNPNAMGIIYGVTTAVMVAVTNIRKAIILALIFSAFNYAHLLINPEITIQTEPFINKAMKDLLLGGLIISYLRASLLGIKPNNFVPMPIPIILFIFYILIHGVIFNSGSWILIGLYYRHFVVYPFLIIIAGSAFLNLDDIKTLMNWLFLVSFIVVAVGVLEIVLRIPTSMVGTVNFGFFDRRIISVMGHPVNIYQYLAVPFFFAFNGWLLGTWKITRVLIYTIIVGAGVFMCFTRAAFFTYPIGILISALLTRKIKGIGVLLLAVMFAGYVFPIIVQARQTVRKYGARGALLKQELKYVTSSAKLFIVGEGMGQGLEMKGTKITTHTTDNMYMTFWRQTGILGLGFFLLVLITITWKLIMIFRGTITMLGRQFVLAVLAYHIMIMVASLAGIAFKTYPPSFVYWILIGISFSIPILERRTVGLI